VTQMLKDKVAVVTGSGRGIGRGVALLMAEHGAKVVVNDYGVAVDGSQPSEGPAHEVVAEIKARGGTAVPVYDNVSQFAGGQRIVQSAVDHFGRIDILVNCAGILRDRMVFNMTEEEWDSVIAVHLKGHFNTIRHASTIMRQQRYGRIVNFTSSVALFGGSGQANYGAAKGGIAGLTKVAARDLGRYGITVNAINPHAETRMLGTIPQAGKQARSAFELRREYPIEPLPDDPCPPEAIAPMVVYLASEEAANVNGQVFFVWGGSIALCAQPRPLRSFYKGSRFTVEELIKWAPSTFAKGLTNPAPPEPAPAPAPVAQEVRHG